MTMAPSNYVKFQAGFLGTSGAAIIVSDYATYYLAAVYALEASVLPSLVTWRRGRFCFKSLVSQ